MISPIIPPHWYMQDIRSPPQCLKSDRISFDHRSYQAGGTLITITISFKERASDAKRVCASGFGLDRGASLSIKLSPTIGPFNWGLVVAMAISICFHPTDDTEETRRKIVAALRTPWWWRGEKRFQTISSSDYQKQDTVVVEKYVDPFYLKWMMSKKIQAVILS